MKDKELMKGFRWSLLVHGTLVVLLLLNGLGSGGGADGGTPLVAKEEGAPVQVEIIDLPKKSDEDPIEVSEKDALLMRAPHANDECPDSFGGIGITENNHWTDASMTAVITTVSKVHHGYPAEKAGILIGDEVLNSAEIRGEIGTPVTVRVMRDGVEIIFDLIRDKICTTKPEPQSQGDSP